MDVQQLYPAHIVPASVSRLSVFAAASIALHVLTLAAYAPAGVLSSLYSGPAVNGALHATLMPLERDALAQDVGASSSEPLSTQDVEHEVSPSAHETDDTKSNVPDVLASVTPRSGAPEGLDLPIPDKWFTAQELDVRAEPLTAAELVYPPELVHTAAVGRVRILLFIDERGIVRKSQIAAGASEALFDKAAIKAWKQVRFSPAEKNGVAVKSQKLLEMEFLPF